jgi:arylsulfatase
VYDLLGITPPETVKAVPQKPLEGVSFKAALDNPKAKTAKETQFYTMLGTRGIWHRGWFANAVHAAAPSGWGHFDKDRWELFHIEADRSQCHDLAAEHPEKLEEMKKLWFAEADRYNGLPLADFSIMEVLGRQRPSLAGDRSSYTYYPHTAPVPLGACVNIAGRSFSVLAEVTVESADVRGVLLKQGAGHGGYTLFVADGRLHFVYNFFGELEQKVSSPDPVPLGKHILGVGYARTGTVEGSFIPQGDATLYVDGAAVATLPGVKAHPFIFGLAGGGVSVGRNLGQPVSASYQAPFEFTGGTIARVVVDVSGIPYIDAERQFATAFAKD